MNSQLLIEVTHVKIKMILSAGLTAGMLLGTAPAMALDGGEDGLEVIRTIVSGAPDFLAPAGRLFLEIGADQGAPVAALLRVLLRYHGYRLLVQLVRREGETTGQPRVSIDDYVANMGSIAKITGERVVFLTRPHRDPPEAMRTHRKTWFRQAPSYNDAFETSRPVRLVIIDWYSYITCSVPWLASAWYGV